MQLDEYLSKGIRNIMATAYRNVLSNPREAKFAYKMQRLFEKSEKRRQQLKETDGLDVPPFLICSIATMCNLHCKGCYARANGIANDSDTVGKTTLSPQQWRAIFDEAASLGVNFALLAGGEPLMRRRTLSLLPIQRQQCGPNRCARSLGVAVVPQDTGRQSPRLGTYWRMHLVRAPRGNRKNDPIRPSLTAGLGRPESIHQYNTLNKNKMEIKAVKFRRDGFYSQPFAFGGEEGMDKFDKNIRYRGSLQNYLIDTGNEVILVDTGLPAGTPEEVPDENSLAFTGKDVCTYMEAFAALGYKPEQVTKILLTHRHNDHSGELKSFPNAKVYVNAEEMDSAELQGLTNIVPVTFTDGAYYNFPESQTIAEGIHLIKAKGHTKGNSIIVVENEGLFYMLHGDITYVDEALYEDKLSVVFDDLPAARETQNRIREFVRNHPTVYCGTHTPQGYENLEAKRVMDLDHPVPTVFAEVDFTRQEASGKYVCSICGYVYDPAEHDGVAFEDLPDDWRCPRCKQPKEKFNKA